MAKIKFFDEKNLILGFKILLASIVAMITVGIILWLARWLIAMQEMLALGVVIAILGFFLYYNTLGYWARRLFGIKG